MDDAKVHIKIRVVLQYSQGFGDLRIELVVIVEERDQCKVMADKGLDGALSVSVGDRFASSVELDSWGDPLCQSDLA